MNYQRTYPDAKRLVFVLAEYEHFKDLTDEDPDIQEAYNNRVIMLEKLIQRLNG